MPEEDYGLNKVSVHSSTYLSFEAVQIHFLSHFLFDKFIVNYFQITREKVEIHYIEGNHVTMLDSDKVVAAINGEPLIDTKTFKKLLAEDRPLEYLDEKLRT